MTASALAKGERIQATRVASALDELVTLFRREEDPASLFAASRAIVATVDKHPTAELDLAKLQGRIVHLLGATNAIVRAARSASSAARTSGTAP